MSVIRFKMLYPNARITVFEADSGVAEVLAENIESLGLSDVSVIPVSVGTVDGTVPFLHDGLDGGRICNVAESRIAVPSVRLADQIRERIDLLKLDIEGAEFSVISDLVASTAIQRVRRIVCEVHCTPHCCNKLAALFGDLADAGFSVCIGHAGRWKLPAPPDRLPFVRLGSGYFLVHLYAWRPPVANTQCS